MNNLSKTADLSVVWELISNDVAENPTFRAAFTLTNNGKDTLQDKNWAMYYSQTNRPIIEGSVKGPASIRQIKGDFYELKPKSGFALAPGASTTITFDGGAWLISKSDTPSHPYFVFSDEAGKEGKPFMASHYEFRPFDEPKKINRSKADLIPIADAAYRFAQNEKLVKLPEGSFGRIIPSPVKIIPEKDLLKLDASFSISTTNKLSNEAAFLAKGLRSVLGGDIAIKDAKEKTNKTIHLQVDPKVVKNAEAYHLKISGSDGITITGHDAAGVFYGVQSLLALLPLENKDATINLQGIGIEDAPRFPYRGIHVDVARNFQNKASMLKVIDAMARYKLNKLHLHLTDDEGWRLEIDGLPELTSYGAKRGHTVTEENHLQPSYGSGPTTDNSFGTGYYSIADYIEIVKYAKANHIEVIPELNMPGHARAAIKSMDHRYLKLMKAGKQKEANEYLLSDPDDKSIYKSVQDFPDNVVCACRESVFHFYEKIVEEVVKMHEEAGAPLLTVHTGGDEVPNGVWEKSPICQQLINDNENINNTVDIKTYFIGRLNKILSAHNLITAGWEEIAMKKVASGKYIAHPDFTQNNFLPYIWQNLWGQQDLANRMVNAGYDVVLCNVTNLYFDLAYEKDPEEPGLYWGGFVDAKKGFELIPFDILTSTPADPLGNKFTAATYKDMERMNPSAKKHVKGLQGQLWSETLNQAKMIEYYMLPKLLGLAERAWSPQPAWAVFPDADMRNGLMNENWNVLANTIGQHELHRIGAAGFNYRIPLPGAIIKDGQLHANIAYPGLTIRYTTDGSEPTEDSPVYDKPVAVTDAVILKAFDKNGLSSRASKVIPRSIDELK